MRQLKFSLTICKVLITCLLVSLIQRQVNAANLQSGHEITVRIRNCKDTLFYLKHFSAGEISYDDTARMDMEGKIIFTGTEKLEEGLYCVYSDHIYNYFDFFITEKQELTVGLDNSNRIGSLTTSDSSVNKTYFKVLAALKADLARKSDIRSDSLQFLLAKSDFSDPAERLILKGVCNTGSIGEKYIAACIPPAVYQRYFLSGTIKPYGDPVRSFLDHYFDNLDFSDYRLVNTPIITKRIDEFIDTITAMPGLRLQPEVDRLIILTSVNKKMQEFVTWHMLSRFGMYYFLPGYDAVYVHIISDFLANGRIAWYYPEVRERELGQAKKLENLLAGKIGPDLEIPDSAGTFHELYSIQAKYTLLLFWASTCSHCRDEMPAISKFYLDFHKAYDLEIYGVSTDTSVSRWKSYIRRHQLPWINVYGRKNIRGSYHQLYNIQSTPSLFLLDEKKTILAKYLKPEEFGKIILKRESEKQK